MAQQVLTRTASLLGACAALVLCTAAKCEPKPPAPGLVKACGVSIARPEVMGKRVVGRVRPSCDQPPASHQLRATLEVQVGGEWMTWGRELLTRRIPDQAGFEVIVGGECREGEYRVRVRVTGTGPAPKQLPFQHTETGRSAQITKQDCDAGR
ncbi:hypothetical protein [Crossiella sp. CA198]|uniref:hypothetical protein n=1 Tax=Crossiella sp. CA198 TaxID=3455607 RepID=UPI003F8CFABD